MAGMLNATKGKDEREAAVEVGFQEQSLNIGEQEKQKIWALKWTDSNNKGNEFGKQVDQKVSVKDAQIPKKSSERSIGKVEWDTKNNDIGKPGLGSWDLQLSSFIWEIECVWQREQKSRRLQASI